MKENIRNEALEFFNESDLHRNLKSEAFRIFYCVFCSSWKILIAFALIRFWDYGIYAVVAYVLYALQGHSFEIFRVVEQSNKTFNKIVNKIDEL